MNAAIVDQTAVLMARFQVRSDDALHAATAIEVGADYLATIDADSARITDLSCILIRDPASTDI